MERKNVTLRVSFQIELKKSRKKVKAFPRCDIAATTRAKSSKERLGAFSLSMLHNFRALGGSVARRVSEMLIDHCRFDIDKTISVRSIKNFFFS